MTTTYPALTVYHQHKNVVTTWTDTQSQATLEEKRFLQEGAVETITVPGAFLGPFKVVGYFGNSDIASSARSALEETR